MTISTINNSYINNTSIRNIIYLYSILMPILKYNDLNIFLT